MEIIKTTTSDGLNFTGLYSKPKNKSNTIIIHIHGMSGDIYTDSWYQQMHTYYPKNGIAFLAGETRGTHSITQFVSTKTDDLVNIGNAFEVFEDCVYDIEAWVNKAKSLGYKNIWLQGHSLGTSKITYYLTYKLAKNIAGLILLSPSDMVGCFIGSVNKQHPVLKKAKELYKNKKSDQLLTDLLLENTLVSAKTILNFFDKNTNLAIFNFANQQLGFSVVNKIKVPVLAITGTKDDGIVSVIDPYKAMQILTDKLINCPRKKTIVYKNAYHPFEGFEQNIVKDVVRFVLG